MTRLPPLYGDARRWALAQADALDLLHKLPDASVDAVVTDPPYGIDFNRQAWDGRNIRNAVGDTSRGAGAFQTWISLWASECLRILRPGGYLVAFGATRTAHRLTAGIEDAGFEVRDQLAWLYGSGVPKTGLHNGRSGTLKPGYEPIVLARKPRAQGDGLPDGLLAIDAARIEGDRWPANVLLGHDRRCTRRSCARACPVGELDRQHPTRRPSRFYYCAKPARREREHGLGELQARTANIFGGRPTRPRRNVHPTVKPVELMRWLIRLTAPEGAVVLDPFAGSGTTGLAALAEHRQFVGIEQDETYTRIAVERLRDAATPSEQGADGARASAA